MPKPTPGSFYTVVAGDRIRSIARIAYGWDRSSDIVNDNADLLKDRIISLEGLPTIYGAPNPDRLSLPAVLSQFSQRACRIKGD